MIGRYASLVLISTAACAMGADAAPVRIGQEIQDQDSETCDSGTTCDLTFSVYSTTRPFRLNFVSCRITVPQDAEVRGLYIRRNGTSEYVALEPTLFGTDAELQVKYLASTQVTNYILPAGTRINAFVQLTAVATGDYTIGCTIHGVIF
jgi:hypothetical protein